MRSQELALLRAKYEKHFFEARSRDEYQQIAVEYGVEYDQIQQQRKITNSEASASDCKSEQYENNL